MKKKPKAPINPCPKCNREMVKKIMAIIDGPCWNCNKLMKIACIYSEPYEMLRDNGTNLSPSSFTESEIEFARSKGAVLKVNYSKTKEQSYLANTCAKEDCGNFAGDHYLFTDYISPAGYGELTKEEFDLGSMCPDCD